MWELHDLMQLSVQQVLVTITIMGITLLFYCCYKKRLQNNYSKAKVIMFVRKSCISNFIAKAPHLSYWPRLVSVTTTVAGSCALRVWYIMHTDFFLMAKVVFSCTWYRSCLGWNDCQAMEQTQVTCWGGSPPGCRGSFAPSLWAGAVASSQLLCTVPMCKVYMTVTHRTLHRVYFMDIRRDPCNSRAHYLRALTFNVC